MEHEKDKISYNVCLLSYDSLCTSRMMGMDFTTIDRARLLLFTSGRRPNALMMS